MTDRGKRWVAGDVCSQKEETNSLLAGCGQEQESTLKALTSDGHECKRARKVCCGKVVALGKCRWCKQKDQPFILIYM